MGKVFDKKMKMFTGMFMTRKECLSIHQGRHTPESVNGNGSLKKEKIKFWAAVTGLITVLTALFSTLIIFLAGKIG